jgi:hypothetical protein
MSVLQAAAARGAVNVCLARFTPMRHMISGWTRISLTKVLVDQRGERLGATKTNFD